MGLFMETAIIQNGEENIVKAALERIEDTKSSFALSASECQYQKYDKGVLILFNEGCNGYDELAKELSEEINSPVLLLYIYDDDFWGYYFYENGKEIDCFYPMPDYFDEGVTQERLNYLLDKKVIVEYFGVEEKEIENYLVLWSEDLEEQVYISDIKAYEDDEFGQCDCWQMADFMRKLGYPYIW